MRIVFFGSAEFSIPSLRALVDSRHEVVGVVTAPDKPRGRGRKLKPTVVAEFAAERGIPTLKPADLRDPRFLSKLRSFGADLFVVVAFRILPREVFELPPAGTVNLHASLLPKYRGAAPVQWAILNGESETGVTTFFIEEKVDTGDILLQRKVPILPDETAGELAGRLAEIGAELLLETIDAIERGEARAKPQEGEAIRAPKINREMGRIDWNEPAERIARLIRALSPDPAAFAFWQGKQLSLLRARALPCSSDGSTPGTVVRADAKRGELLVRAGSGCVQILEVQPSGKRVMSAAEFLRGYRLAEGDRFETEAEGGS